MADAEVPPPPPPPPPGEEAGPGEQAGPPAKRQKTAGGAEVAAALAKITAHISSAAKFRKAAALLRELIKSEALGPAHASALFEALRAAMQHPERAVQPELTLEYQRLFTAASTVAEIFSARQRSQLDVYGLWGVLRGRLLTDDSFVFNKALGQIKECIGHLPEVEPGEGDEEALASSKARLEQERQDAAAARAAKGRGDSGPSGAVPEAAPEAASEAAPEAAAPEADPFQLDAIVAPKPAPQPPRVKAVVWGARECLALKRVALLDCLDTAQGRYGQPWAKTSVDLAIELLHGSRARFCPSQGPRIDAFVRFVKEERAKRRQGPSAAERRRDQTSFEAARREWGRVEGISTRAAVGGDGDHHSEVWLG